jgi:hypothetical protein
MVYRLETDLINNVLTEKDLIIVAHTSIHRWFYLDKKGKEISVMSAHPSFWESETFREEYLTYACNNSNNFYNLHKDVKYLIYFHNSGYYKFK